MPVSAAAVILGNIFDYYILANTSEEGGNLPDKDHKPQVKLPSTLPIVQVTLENMQCIVGTINDTQVVSM